MKNKSKKKKLWIVIIILLAALMVMTVMLFYHQKEPEKTESTYAGADDTIEEVEGLEDFEQRLGIEFTKECAGSSTRFYILNGDTAQIVSFKKNSSKEREEFAVRAKKSEETIELFEPPKEGTLIEEDKGKEGTLGMGENPTAHTLKADYIYDLPDTEETGYHAQISTCYILENQTQYALYAPGTVLSKGAIESIGDHYSVDNFARLHRAEQDRLEGIEPEPEPEPKDYTGGLIRTVIVIVVLILCYLLADYYSNKKRVSDSEELKETEEESGE